MPTFILDNQEIEFQAGEDILRAALREKKFIPHYCAHDALSRVATCRMCLVDVVDAGNGRPITKLQTACSTPAAAGMKVITKNSKVEEARKSVMEFLLINHPLDCGICDQSGECELQNFSFKYGSGVSKVEHQKRIYGWRDIGTFLQLERNRCIHCTRCVRFTQEITGTFELGTFGRTHELTVDNFIDNPLTDLFQGNLADICPVGAITSRSFRFRKRVWMLNQTPSICTACSTGCNTFLCHHRGEMFRIIPRENHDVNKWWMCDIGRVDFYKYIEKEKRLLSCFVEGKNTTHRDAYSKCAELLQNAIQQGSKFHIIGSNFSTNEELQTLKYFGTQLLGNAEFYAPEKPIEKTPSKRFIETLITNDKSPNSYGLEKNGFDVQNGFSRLKKHTYDENSIFIIVGIPTEEEWFLKLIENAAGIIHLTVFPSVITQKSTVTFPICSPLEKNGHYTNKTGLVQKNRAAISQISPSTDEVALWYEIAKKTFTEKTFPQHKEQWLSQIRETNEVTAEKPSNLSSVEALPH